MPGSKIVQRFSMRVSRLRLPAIATAALLVSQTFAAVDWSWGQDTSSTPQNQSQQQQPKQQPNDQQQTSPDAGGPGNDTGPIAIPKKGPAKTEAPPPPKTVKNPPELNNYSLRVDVPVVNVDVNVITEKTHQFIPNLEKDNFRVYEDGAPQQIIGFRQVKAPITAVLLLEFAANDYNFIFDMWNAAVSFTNQLQPNDYVAVVTYD